jgi:HSP20 family molecular chaperone IbpA
VKSRDLSNWMWGEALSMLDRADRLHRQFFTQRHAAWEPPVDVVETEDAVYVQVALPGVAADAITLAADGRGLVVSALRGFAGADCGHGARIHRVEIPYGRFERRLPLDLEGLELAGRSLADGVLTLTFQRKESK